MRLPATLLLLLPLLFGCQGSSADGSGDSRGFLERATTRGPAVAWSFSTEAPNNANPLVLNDTVYFGSGDRHLYALDLHTGEERWRFQADEWIHGAPTYFDGVLYVGANSGHVYAIDPETGRAWVFQTSTDRDS